MPISRLFLKHAAKEKMLERRQPNLFLVTLLYTAIVMILSLITSRLTDYGVFREELANRYLSLMDSFMQTGRLSALVIPEFRVTLSGTLFHLAALISQWVIRVGYTIYARNVVRGETADTRTLFDGFNYFGKVLLITLITSVLFYVGLFFLVVPAILFSCMYSQAVLLMLDHPERSALWCLRTSRQMMRGRKMEFFMLQLSFIGWLLLSSMPYIGYAAHIWASPYMELSYVLYYDALVAAQPPTGTGGPWEQ